MPSSTVLRITGLLGHVGGPGITAFAQQDVLEDE